LWGFSLFTKEFFNFQYLKFKYFKYIFNINKHVKKIYKKSVLKMQCSHCVSIYHIQMKMYQWFISNGFGNIIWIKNNEEFGYF